MYHYSAVQWLFVFFFYCVGGWCFESAYVSICDKKLTNRGFIRGPLLPIYGSGATMMLVVSMPFRDNLILTYLAGCVGATALEYITGVLMEAIFKVRYWDYSDKRFNFQGHICLSSTVAWGFFTVLTTKFLQPCVEKLMFAIPAGILPILVGITLVLFSVDFALSFKAAIDLRILLEKLHQVSKEMQIIHKRLDVYLAFAEEEFNIRKDLIVENMSTAKDGITDKVLWAKDGITDKVLWAKDGITDKVLWAKDGITDKMLWAKDGITENVHDLKAGIEGKLEKLKAFNKNKPGRFTEAQQEELLELRTKYSINAEKQRSLSKVRDFFQRRMLQGNPGMTSVHYREALEELKAQIDQKDTED